MSHKIDDKDDAAKIETQLTPESSDDIIDAEEFNEEALVKRFEAEASDAEASDEVSASEIEVDGTELDSYESAEIEEEEFLEDDQIISVVESILFATDKPVSIATIKQAFKGSQVRTNHIRRALDSLAVDYAGGRKGVTLEEVNSGYQLRTKVDNLKYLRQMIKIRPFKLSGPALEVLAIIAYKQPIIKSQVDEIRGVESGHLMRALMEKGLVNFAGKSELPGKPMFYQTTRKFLEIFGLRNLRELPSLSEIDDLIPEGIGEEVEEKETLSDVTEQLSEQVGVSYSQGEEELMKISSELEDITTSSEFFEQEKLRVKAKKEAERAQDIRDALTVGEEVATKDKKWLEKYDARFLEEQQAAEQQQAGESAMADISTEVTGEALDETLEAAPKNEIEVKSDEEEQALSTDDVSSRDEEREVLALDAVDEEARIEPITEESVTATELIEEQKSEDLTEATQKDRIGRVMTDLDQALSQFGGAESQIDEEKYEEDLSVFEEDKDSEPEAEV